MNTEERLRIKGLSASACSLWPSYSLTFEQCNRPRNLGRIAFHSYSFLFKMCTNNSDSVGKLNICSETIKYMSPHFWCGRFCLAVLVVAVLDVICCDRLLSIGRHVADHFEKKLITLRSCTVYLFPQFHKNSPLNFWVTSANKQINKQDENITSANLWLRW